MISNNISTENATTELSPTVSAKPPFWNRPRILSALLVVIVVMLAWMSLTNSPGRQIKAVASEDFAESGRIIITGFGSINPEELESYIILSPSADFTVALSDGNRKEAVLTITEPRNIAYTFDINIPNQNSGGYQYTTEINGPQLIAKMENSTNIESDEYVTISFSEQVDVVSLQENIIVTPYTEYTLEYDRDDVIIIPVDGWLPGERYSVSIGEGYRGRNGKQLANRQSFYFGVKPIGPSVSYMGRRSYLLNSEMDIELIFEGTELTENVPLVVDTYRIPTIEQYREQSKIYLDYNVPLSNLEKVESNVFLVENGTNSFKLPHPGEGTYIIASNYKNPKTGEEVQKRASYLISPYSVYVQSSTRDVLVWLTKTNEGAKGGYTFAFGENEEIKGTTAADGTLFIDKPLPTKQQQQDIYRYRYDNSGEFAIYDPDGALVYFDNGINNYNNHNERYYSYLFTDRTLYKPDDTISFWGYVKPFRNNLKEMPDKVTVTFDAGGMDIKQELKINANGVFSGEISLERIKSSQYELSATLNFPSAKEGEPDEVEVLDNLYLSVKEYVKPSYVLSSSADDLFYGPNDDASVTVSATFYDGTPLPNFPIEMSYMSADGDWSDYKTIETDDKGQLKFSFPAWSGGGDSSLDATPYQRYFRARIASDGETITHMGEYVVFPSDVLVDAKLSRAPGENNVSLAVKTYRLDIKSDALRREMESLKDGPYGPSYYRLTNERLLEIARGEPVDVTDATVSLRWDYYDTRNIRHRYIYDRYNNYSFMYSNSFSLDYISNQNANVTVIEDPNSSEKLVKFSTVNGEATLRDLIYLDGEAAINFARPSYCRANLTFVDGVGNSRDKFVYYSSIGDYVEDWSEPEDNEAEIVPGYSFNVKNLSTGKDVTPKYYYYGNSLQVDIGETLRFSLMQDSKTAPKDRTILYSIIQDGVMERRLVKGNSFDFTYKMEHGMNLRIVAVCFDGRGISGVRQLTLYANESTMSLKVEVTPDKSAYRPGDKVNLSVSATDSNGRGIAGNMCVAVVDESIFALSEQYVNVLNSLYATVGYLDNYVSQYFTSYRDETSSIPGDEGKGGGQGAEFYDSYRSNFKDTAIFLPVTLNASGRATLSFTLPDNTTSWRITAVAVGQNLTAGQSKSNIISTLPFFVKPVLTPKYIEGDTFAMLVQGHGTLLNADSDISYSVTVKGDGYSETKTASAKAYIPQEISFGQLPVGSYTVVSKASYGGYSDTVELPINVIKSNLELVVNRPIDLTKPIDISAVRYPVTLTFYDKKSEPFVASISSLFGHYCMQTSQRLSRVVAKKILRESMPGQEIPIYMAETSENIADMQNLDGGIGHFIGGESDPLLTNYVLLATKDKFNTARMIRYFESELTNNNDPKIIAASHLGLAVLGKGDVKALEKLIAEAERIDVKAYYIAAIASLNETGKALKLYNEICAPLVAKRNNPKAYLNDANIEWERDAAASWIAASLLHHSDADALSLHFAKTSWRYRTLYECMIYVSNYQNAENLLAKRLSYSVNGQENSVTLGASISNRGYFSGRSSLMHTLVLSKSDLESFKLLDFSEDITATAYYIGEPTEIGIQPSNNMSIDKTIAAVDDNTYEVTLKVHLEADAPKGQYDISDWVPSNSRLYEHDEFFSGREQKNEGYDSPKTYFTVKHENQNLYVSFNNNTDKEKTIIFRYQIRKTFSSPAALDTAYIIHGDSGENNSSKKGIFAPDLLNKEDPAKKV